MAKNITLILHYSGQVPGPQGSAENQAWQLALTRYACPRAGHSRIVEMEVPSFIEDPNHVLRVSLMGDTPQELDDAFKKVPAPPENLGLRLTSVTGSYYYHVDAIALTKYLNDAFPGIHRVSERPRPILSSAKCG